VALDPDMKLKYFEVEWTDHSDWIQMAKSKSKDLWESEYRSHPSFPRSTTFALHTSGEGQQHSSNEAASATSTSTATDATLSRWKTKKRARLTHEDMDQWDRFQIAEEVDEVEDLLGYWSTRLKNPRWSQLSHMALEIHSIAAMSAQVERVFSRLVPFLITPCHSTSYMYSTN